MAMGYRSDKINVETACVCSRHFLDGDFERNMKYELFNYLPKKRSKLKCDVVPSVLIPNGKSPIDQTGRQTKGLKRSSIKLVETVVGERVRMANRQRFTSFDDNCLLREVLLNNPFKNPGDWDLVHENVVRYTRKEFTMRAIKDHLDHLLKLFVQGDASNLRKSGTEDEYATKTQMLQEVFDLRKEYQKQNVKRKANKSDKEEGTKQRKKATDIMLDDSASQNVIYVEEVPGHYEAFDLETSLSPRSGSVLDDHDYILIEELDQPDLQRNAKKKVPMKKASLEYLQLKQEAEIKFKERKLTLKEKRLLLKERKMALAEAKFELEKKEREQRLKEELEDRKLQRKLLEALLARTSN